MKKHSQWKRFTFALIGFRAAWQNERSFRTEIVLASFFFLAMVVARPGVLWWLATGLTAGMVLGAELFNTAIENMCDALHPDQHPLIGMAKDCASAAVLVSVLTAGGVFLGLIGHLLHRW